MSDTFVLGSEEEATVSATEGFAEEVDELSEEFVEDLIDKVLEFTYMLAGHPLHLYQIPFARRIIRSVVTNDGALLTALAARQSGKSEILANVVAALMVLLPRLARIYPDLLGKFADGFWVGMFAPIEAQAETLFGRTVTRLSSERAMEILGDPEIDDVTAKNPGVTRGVKLKKSGSVLLMMTANPRAKIESKSFHLIIIDECQDADDLIVSKSISPMGAYYNATMVKTGTPTTRKNNFYKSIQINKRSQVARASRRSHFEWTWKDVVKVNPNYKKYIRKEMLQLGEDSDEFQMSYSCRWMLDRGMFISQSMLDELGDTSQQVVRGWNQSPVVVGVDPARRVDSTVVTILWVNWDSPDEFGYYDHRVLNWLELQGDDWEEQYFQIVNFLAPYDVLAVGVDSTGVGDAVAQRLKLLLPRSEVISMGSNQAEQAKRWKYLTGLIQRRSLGWPAHAKTQRLKVYQRFMQQMLDAEKKFTGQYFSVRPPTRPALTMTSSTVWPWRPTAPPRCTSRTWMCPPRHGSTEEIPMGSMGVATRPDNRSNGCSSCGSGLPVYTWIWIRSSGVGSAKSVLPLARRRLRADTFVPLRQNGAETSTSKEYTWLSLRSPTSPRPLPPSSIRRLPSR